MLKAISMIQSAKAQKSVSTPVTVDLHPSRPDFRGIQILEESISLQADPSFQAIEENGGKVAKHSETHTVLDDFFLISGEIPRVTEYEIGLKHGIRFDKETKLWTPDEKILDERFLMVNLKGIDTSIQSNLFRSILRTSHILTTYHTYR